MLRLIAVALASLLLLANHSPNAPAARVQKRGLKVGVASLAITPFGPAEGWDGTITQSGVWGEKFTDNNNNGRWDAGEPFEDDPGNDALDSSSKGKYDGVFLAGFGNNRLATAKHDDLWARAIVLDHGTIRIAIVSIDLIGYYSKAKYYGLGEITKLVDPKLGVSEILIASTHNHEAPDTIGAWGPNSLGDGKYPKYLRFVDRQIAKAINKAAASAVPAVMKLGRTDPIGSPSIAGMQTRTHGRPPDFFDQELSVMQFFDASRGRPGNVIATLINWATHPESMESANTLITSDFPHAVRDAVQHKYGGTAVYISGALGAVEIIGDSNTKPTDRARFDGKVFPLKPRNNRPEYTFERTEAIGRDVAEAVVIALSKGTWSAVSGIDLKKATLKAPMDNAGYVFLTSKGVLDTMTMPREGESIELETTVYAITIGDAQIITTPGELFPELYYGVEQNRRRDCDLADTKRPAEPGVRDRMTKRYKFVFGLCPDEFGYIVPGYDFHAPKPDPARGLRQAQDPCKASGVPDHYHETNSASSVLAPRWACVAATLLQGKTPNSSACKN